MRYISIGTSYWKGRWNGLKNTAQADYWEMRMKTGRNEACPCGSGKKYKKCCLAKDRLAASSRVDKQIIQSAKHEARQQLQLHSGVNIRPYSIAKICDPTGKSAQDFFASRSDLTVDKDMVSLSKIRALSTEQIIQQMLKYGIAYDQGQFVAACEKEESAWDVAQVLWPDKAKSLVKNVSDVACISACMLWKRLYEQGELTRVSVEMLVDWMEDGYHQLETDNFKACEIWMKVWETFKDNYDLSSISLGEVDSQFNGSQSLFNWCQDFEMSLLNAAIGSKVYAEMGVNFLSEFITYFANEDAHLINQFRSTLGECYCYCGDQEAGEKVMEGLIKQYPDRVMGYIGMETAYHIKEKNGDQEAHKQRLKILEQAKNYPVIDGDDYDLDKRISWLSK